MAVDQLAIDNLQLDVAFSSNVYKPFEECWCVRMDSELMVVDDDSEKFSRYSDDEDDRPKALVIVNNHNRQIVLLSIDNKLICGHPGGIADCALFDESQFRFIEFKTNAYGNSEEQIRETFEKAISQIVETIRLFKERLQAIDICFETAVALSCHVVLSQSFPRSRAVKQEYQVRFADENDGLGLSFADKTYWEGHF